jgi:predicted Rossmann-fold nucleotide-binding protein
MGTMEAVSCGAAEAGGHVIGVGSAQIEQFRSGSLNQWVTEAILYETLRERLYHLVIQNDGMIVLPGGIGTLSEFALAWSLLQVGEVEERPLVLLGDIWRDTMRAFIRSDFVGADHAALLHHADTPQEAVEIILAGKSDPDNL